MPISVLHRADELAKVAGVGAPEPADHPQHQLDQDPGQQHSAQILHPQLRQRAGQLRLPSRPHQLLRQEQAAAICGPLGSPAHGGAISKITSSMCHTMTELGQEHSGSSGRTLSASGVWPGSGIHPYPSLVLCSQLALRLAVPRKASSSVSRLSRTRQ